MKNEEHTLPKSYEKSYKKKKKEQKRTERGNFRSKLSRQKDLLVGLRSAVCPRLTVSSLGLAAQSQTDPIFTLLCQETLVT